MLSSSPLLLLLLPLLPPSLGCHTSSFTECQLLPFVPGHNLAGEGFDVVKMQTSGASVVDVKSFMVGGAQGNCTVCFNHLLNQTQKLPVSVLDWRIKVQCRRSLSSKVFESSQSVMKEMSSSLGTSWKVGLSIAGLGGFAVGGSHSVSSQFAESHSRKDKFSFTTHNFNCKYYTFRLHSRPPLSKEFKVSLKNLPSTYHHKNTSAFQHFISIYGTHFIRRVHLGGRVHSMTAIRTCEAAMSKLSVRTVSNCLSVEASATIKGVTAKASSEFCHKKSKSLKTGATFSQAFSDRTTEVLGGDGNVGDILFNPNGAAGYKKWLHSLSRVPGVVSYQISPLHLLVSDNPILKSSLRDAISDYIRKSAKALHCSPSCKIGNQNQNCACQCKGHHMVDSNCCPAEPGVARLNVTVVQAQGLWGDYFSKTDGYVKVFYGGQSATTPVIWNDDFPRWNYLVRFQTVNLRHRVPVIFEVWDRDNVWDDDLLGKVSVIPTMGRNVHKTFKLKHGSLFVKLSAVCAPSLQGSLCENYVASPDYQGIMGYKREEPEDHWGSGRSAQEAHGAYDNSLL
ncbi:LOW QUALITY PROTEIN: perforin-1.3 [Lates calcarifer]|uniref:LOW QUALITY PROTEIN: perforin-1.3 n=1 Tax=Lates calcarifer TaxID=8187 RepID=A0AAJ7Q0U6_LATCA|nr:LOW QUALITY PROTEIN: perforin-1.3 [Lates calcarifer]